MVLPSLWPRKKNTRGPPEDDEEVFGNEGIRDLKEEARKEVEEEMRGERELRERERISGFEGLRWRNRGGDGGYEVPGAMPGMMVN